MTILSFYLALYFVIALGFSVVLQRLVIYFMSRNVNASWFYTTSLAWPITIPIAIVFVIYHVIKKKFYTIK